MLRPSDRVRSRYVSLARIALISCLVHASAMRAAENATTEPPGEVPQAGRESGGSWPQFRGPGGKGIATTPELPDVWGADEKIAWKVKVPGTAWSQPIVWAETIVITCAVTDDQPKPAGNQSGAGDVAFSFSDVRKRGIGAILHGGDPPDAVYHWRIMCLDGRSGKTLWEREPHTGRPSIPIHRSNTYASETPVTDGERIIAYFGMTGVFCYDMQGKLLWSKDLGTHPMQFGWGTGGSPTLHGNNVFVQCDNETSSFLVALDKCTGDEVWRVARDEKSNWATPFVWKNESRTELVTAGGKKARSYDPTSGELLWEVACSGRSAATPVADGQRVYLGATDRLMGRSGTLIAIRAGASGNIPPDDENEFVAWSAPRAAPQIASPLLYDNCLYMLGQHNGIIRCVDAITGQQHYRQRLPGAHGFTSSPWACDGKVFCLDEAGQTFVLKAGSSLEVLGVNSLDEMFWSSPAIMGDRLLLRGVEHLYCILP